MTPCYSSYNAAAMNKSENISQLHAYYQVQINDRKIKLLPIDF